MASSFWNGEFYFDNVYSETFNVVIIDFDSSDRLKQIGSTINIELNEENTLNGKKSYIEGTRTSENIILQLMKKNGDIWSDGDIINVYNWLFQKDFKKFQTVDYSSGYNLCYYLKAVSFSKFLTPDFRGYLEIEFMSYAPYCYSIPTNGLSLNTNGQSGVLFNYSNLYETYKPKIKITASNSDSIKILNNTNGTFVELSGLNSGEIVTVDCAMGTVINSGGANRFETLKNYNLLELDKGNNNITLTGSANIEFICEFPVII